MSDLARDPKQIGNLIRRARKQRALSQKALGDKAGLRQETISLIENGNPAAKIETLLAVLAALDLEFQIAARSKGGTGKQRLPVMPRPRQHIPLRVLLNNRLVGRLQKEPSGAIYFRYDESWLSKGNATPVSLSLPLRDDAYKGERVAAVFKNLLPDSDMLRRRIAERVGAKGTDAYSLLSQIGRDCVGALQFVPDGDDAVPDTTGITGRPSAMKKLKNC